MGLKAVGVNSGELGTHSCRKGTATMVSSGCTVTPPNTLLFIRCGWSMGVVKEIEIKYQGEMGKRFYVQNVL